MAKKSTKATAHYTYLEKWDTRFGQSERVVVRDTNGKFVDNISLSRLKNAPLAPNTRKG